MRDRKELAYGVVFIAYNASSTSALIGGDRGNSRGVTGLLVWEMDLAGKPRSARRHSSCRRFAS